MASRMFPSESSAVESIVSRMIGEASFCLPGIIEEFDPGPPPIAKVYPAIMRKTMPGNQVKYVRMPLLLTVPVVVPFAQTSGLLITLPIKKGDEGVILFADRMIDNFVEKGGCQPPECCGADNETTEPRAHNLTDAIFIPGIIAKPNGKKILAWNTEAIEIRNQDRSCFISMGTDKNITIKTTGSMNITLGGEFKVQATGDATMNGANVHLNEDK